MADEPTGTPQLTDKPEQPAAPARPQPARPFLDAMPPKRREAFSARLSADPEAARDIVTMARMTEIWCADHHPDAARQPLASPAQELGAFPPGKLPRLCPECAAHERYAEERRATCPKDPRPSCKDCDIHCYSAEESDWQRRAMAYAGPRAMFRGLARESLRHLAQGLTVGRRQDKAKRARRDKGRGQDY